MNLTSRHAGAPQLNAGVRRDRSGIERRRGWNMWEAPMRKRACLAVVAFGLCFVAYEARWATAGAPTTTTYLVVYKPGPSWLQGKSIVEQPLKEHGRYILSLYVKGSLKSGGPFSDDAGGAAVFEAANDEEAKAVVAADPAVTSGTFVAELHPWGLVDWARHVKK
jgi:uncharacterized protein YciI